VIKMQNNSTNETIADCIVDCINESSSLLDDVEILLVAVAALIGLAAWGYKKYQALAADGKITLDEIIDSVDDIKDKVEEAKDQLEVLEDGYDKYKVAELKDALKEKGLAVSGKKDELIARLRASDE